MVDSKIVHKSQRKLSLTENDDEKTLWNYVRECLISKKLKDLGERGLGEQSLAKDKTQKNVIYLRNQFKNRRCKLGWWITNSTWKIESRTAIFHKMTRIEASTSFKEVEVYNDIKDNCKKKKAEI